MLFTILIILSLFLGVAISWVGWFGQRDHDKGRGRNDR